MLGRVDEAVSLVEVDGGIVDGIDDDDAGGCRLAGSDSFAQRFSEEQPTEPVVLFRLVDREPGDLDRANRVAGQSTNQAKPRAHDAATSCPCRRSRSRTL